MKLTAQIDKDYKSMDRYFHKLFNLLREAQEDDKATPVEMYNCDADVSQASYHSFSHYIKPDMIMNIYSLADYWMTRICEYQKINKNLNLESKDIKGNNELQAKHKYLTEYAGLNLSTVQSSYNCLNELRKVRNAFVHGGGHISKERQSQFSSINGIVLSESLICIEDSFIWNTLEHTKKYLRKSILA